MTLLEQHRIVKVACSSFHTIALTSNGRAFSWGGTLHGKSGLGEDRKKKADKFNPEELMYFPKNNLHVENIACGDKHSLAIAYRITKGRTGKP